MVPDASREATPRGWRGESTGVVLLAVGPHDRSAADVYALLLDALAVEIPADERTKPPCCDELGAPPADADLAEALAAAVSALPPRPRRRR